MIIKNNLSYLFLNISLQSTLIVSCRWPQNKFFILLLQPVDKMKSNRDFNRNNKANKAVRGCIYSNLGQYCINRILKLLEMKENTCQVSKEQTKALLCAALESYNYATTLLVTSQSTVGVHHCKNYASKQFSQMQLANRNGEDIGSVKSISNTIVEAQMIELMKRVTEIENNGKSSYSYCV